VSASLRLIFSKLRVFVDISNLGGPCGTGFTCFVEIIMKFSDLLPYIVSTLTTVIGLGIWRYQLIEKRRYEIAERALIGADEAAQAISYIRQSEVDADEMAKVHPNGLRPEKWLLTLQRIQEHSQTFEELRKITKLITMHFGDAAAQPLLDLMSIHGKICNAHAALFYRGDAENLYPSVTYEQGVEGWKKIVTFQDDGDIVVDEINDLERKLSAYFSKYLQPSVFRIFSPFK